jgi:hypothetical protein
MKLQKHHTITRLLPRLRKRLGADAFDVVDHWDADLRAVGLARPDDHAVLVYVCTHGLPNGRYFASLELPPAQAGEPWANHPYTPAGERDRLTFEELVEVIRKHFSP